MIRIVKTEDAIGRPLAHDITEIRPGGFKGPAFLKGHILKRQDVERLHRLGKHHLYVLKPEKDELHEDEAAVALADALCGDGVGWRGEPREGKISLRATRDGLLKVDAAALLQFNLQGDVMCATRHTNTLVKRGEVVAATRAIPLVMPHETVRVAVAAACGAEAGVLRVLPLFPAKAGVIITGDEVYYGRIQDKFQSLLRQKIAALGGDVVDLAFLPDNDQMIAESIVKMERQGANLVITTGGMSVDPDDRTRQALKKAGADDMVYGAAVLPGAMFMVAYLNDTPILGIPACAMYAAHTILDLILPRVLSGEKITRAKIAMLGHGGLCLQCKICRFPVCPFGK
jgi:molybdenum cofactor synthesis domain-containing protein